MPGSRAPSPPRPSTPEPSFENAAVLAINSHDEVRLVRGQATDLGAAIESMQARLEEASLPTPQVLEVRRLGSSEVEFLITGPQEILAAQVKALGGAFAADSEIYASVTATCRGSSTGNLCQQMAAELRKNEIVFDRILIGSLSVSFITRQAQREMAVLALHRFCASPS